MLDLTGKVAFVTGSGSGIGEGTALALARAGADVACTDLDGGRAEATAEQVRGLGRKALAAAVDVRDLGGLEKAVAATVGQLGRLDIAVANAGISRGSNVLTMTEDDVDTVFGVNTKGVFLTVKACAREMVREGRAGRVVVISSVSGERAEMGSSAYCGSKAAVRMMTRCWALDLAPFGITVNSVAPGMTDTRMWGAVAARQDARETLARGLPFGRVGQPADIGNLVCWLASDEAEYMTGSYNVMDGGLLDGRGLTFRDLPERLLEMRERVASEGGESVLASMDEDAAEAAGRAAEHRREHGLF
ncbi:MAG: SDR family NAD(P)-dependent oxidoreductase [Chloroflexi bacterium]|nr:SDR family NAD(P)-dependent oxidoreductase [Chloroflexota bacterium]